MTRRKRIEFSHYSIREVRTDNGPEYAVIGFPASGGAERQVAVLPSWTKAKAEYDRLAEGVPA